MKGSVTVLAQNVLSAISQLLVTPLLLRYSGQEVLGSYAFIMQVVGYSLLMDFGFSVALTRYLCQAYDRPPGGLDFANLLMVGRRILLVTNCIACIYLLLAAAKIEFLLPAASATKSQAQIALVLMAIWTVARTPIYVYSTALVATQNMAEANIIAIVGNAVRLVLAVLFTSNTLGLPGLMLANISAELVQFSLHRQYFRKRHPEYSGRGSGGAKCGREMLRFGLKYWGVNLSVVLLLGSDNIIAGALYGAASASVFYATKMLGSLVVQVIPRVIDNIYPALNELIGKKDYLAVRTAYLQLLRYTLLITIPSAVGIVVFSRSLVTLWVGASQYAGPVMALALAAFVLVQIFNHLHGITTLAVGNMRNWSAVSIGSGVLSIVLGYVFGKYFGIGAILFGTTIAMLPITVFLTRRVFRELKIGFGAIASDVVLPVAKACVPVVGLAVLYNYLEAPPTWSSLGGGLLLFAAVYVAGTWRFGISKPEHLRFQQILRSAW